MTHGRRAAPPSVTMLVSPPAREWVDLDASPAPIRCGRCSSAWEPIHGGTLRGRSPDDLRLLAESAPIAVVVVDEIDRVTCWNPEAERLFGWRASELLGHRNPLSLPGPEPGIDPWRRCVVSGEPVTAERISRRRRDGMLLDLRVSVFPLADDQQKVGGAIAMMTAFGSDRPLEEILGRHCLLGSFLGDPLLVASGSGTIVDVNAAALALYGYERSEMIGLSLSDLCARGKDFVCPTEKILGDGGSVNVEGHHVRKDGSVFPIEATFSVGDIAGERVTIAIIRNITARKQQEASRKLLHDVDRWILANSPLDMILESICHRLATIHNLAIVSITLGSESPEAETHARGGPQAAYLDGLEIHWDETPLGRGLIAEAIRTGCPQELTLETLPVLEPWRERAQRLGLRKVVAIPLIAPGEKLGAFCFWPRRGEDFPIEAAGGFVGFSDQVAVSILEARSRLALQLHRVALDSSIHAVVIIDTTGFIRWVNPSFTRLTGWAAAEILGRNLRVLRGGKGIEALHSALLESARTGEVWRGEVNGKGKDGRPVVVDVGLTPVRDDQGAVSHFVAILEDLTLRRRREEEVRRLTLHDPLTGLPNRRQLEERLEQVVGDSAPDRSAALFLLDIDDFGTLNDLLGHIGGDELLVDLTRLLRKRLRPTDFLARIGGDELAVLMENVKAEEAIGTAERLRGIVAGHPLERGGRAIAFGVSIGIALIDGKVPARTVMARAEATLWTAREAGGNRVVLHDEATGDRADPGDSASKIRNALRDGSFIIHFQSVVPLRGRGGSRFEVLLRMPDDDGRLLLPVSFLPAAERFGLMPAIDRWVVGRAVELLAAHPAMQLFVNLSGSTLADEGILAHFETLVRDEGIAPGRLCFEISESAAARDLELAERWMRRLRQAGCRFALDDFGTGFSSFAYLQALPADYVKIDGSFTRNIDTDLTNRALVKALETVAHTLGKEIIAEGVETAEVADLLAAIGIEHAQGYHWGHPAALEDE